MKINGKFVNSEQLGILLAAKMDKGFDITIEIFNIYGDGQIILEHDDYLTSYVEFSRITPRDEVEIESKKLGTIIRKNR